MLLKVMMPDTCTVCLSLPIDHLKSFVNRDTELMNYLSNYVLKKRESGESFGPTLLSWLGVEVSE